MQSIQILHINAHNVNNYFYTGGINYEKNFKYYPLLSTRNFKLYSLFFIKCIDGRKCYKNSRYKLEALKEFDTDKLQKYVDSSTLNTIANYAQKQEQFKTLGQAIFENLDYEIKDIDLDKKTVTITVKNKDLSDGAKKFAEEITSEYSGVQLLGKLNDVSFLNTKLAELKDLISNAKMEEDGIDITLNIEQGSKNLKLAFDDTAENAVSGGALNAIKSLS